MSDASEVLSAIYESLTLVDEGQKLVRELFEWQVTLLITLLITLPTPSPGLAINDRYLATYICFQIIGQ
jgi:hypothetical protein